MSEFKKFMIGVMVSVIFIIALVVGIVSCVSATCVRGSLHQCCSQSFPCQQSK